MQMSENPMQDTSMGSGKNPMETEKHFLQMKWKIGNVQIDNPFVLAPMAGVTDLPFRILCKEQGAGLICMEMNQCQGDFFPQQKYDRSYGNRFHANTRFPCSYLAVSRTLWLMWRNPLRTEILTFWISIWAVRFRRL